MHPTRSAKFRIYTDPHEGTYRLSQTDSGTVVTENIYNGKGERVVKITPTGSTVYLYDQQGRLIAESDATGTVQREYAYLDGTLLAIFTSENTTPATDLNVTRDPPNPLNPQPEGTIYTLTASASGGSGSYEYRLKVKGPSTNDRYQLLRDYSADGVLAWDTTGRLGKHIMQISARNAGTSDTPIMKWVAVNVSAAGQ